MQHITGMPLQLIIMGIMVLAVIGICMAFIMVALPRRHTSWKGCP